VAGKKGRNQGKKGGGYKGHRKKFLPGKKKNPSAKGKGGGDGTIGKVSGGKLGRMGNPKTGKAKKRNYRSVNQLSGKA